MECKHSELRASQAYLHELWQSVKFYSVVWIELSFRAIRAIRAIQKINIRFFVIGYTNIICSTSGSIHPQVIKPSFRAIQKNLASE